MTAGSSEAEHEGLGHWSQTKGRRCVSFPKILLLHGCLELTSAETPIEQGDDIVAVRRGMEFRIEAKGEGSKTPSSARYGKTFQFVADRDARGEVLFVQQKRPAGDCRPRFRYKPGFAESGRHGPDARISEVSGFRIAPLRGLELDRAGPRPLQVTLSANTSGSAPESLASRSRRPQSATDCGASRHNRGQQYTFSTDAAAIQ